MPQEAMKSLKKALEILNIFLNSQDELSLTEISKKSGLSISTTSRILTVLTEYSYLNQSEKRGKYSIGDIYLNFNYTKSNKAKVRNIAIPHLKRLSREMNEVTAIAFANGVGDISVEGFEDYIKPAQPILRILMNETSGKTPLYCSSLGKVILANLPDESIQKYLKSVDLRQYTPNTIIDETRLRKVLRNIRKEKIAIDNEELFLGVKAVATGIENGKGETIGSIGIIAPTVRLSSLNITKAIPAIKKCAFDISNEIKENSIYF
jgi:IclR family KDG regulon transcriptional repressor